jgi:hypothetical protein
MMEKAHTAAAISSDCSAASSALASSAVTAQPPPSLEDFSLVPGDLQSLILAHSAAPLHTCQASAALLSDPSLLTLWLLKAAAAGLIKKPLKKAVKLQCWAACVELLGSPYTDWMWDQQWEYAVYHAAEAGQTHIVQQLLDNMACYWPQGNPWNKDMNDTQLLDLRYRE